MARPYRLQGENCLYHITSRGDDRKKIFIDGTDYRKFLEYLLAAKEKFKFYLYAYCLMSNHDHLLLETTQPNISSVMQFINAAYTTYYNTKRKRCGHLFQGRYKSVLVDADSYFLELTRYIHLNPVKAKIVTRAEEYPWSSYKGYLNKGGDGVIDKSEIKSHIDMTTKQYRQFIDDGISKESDPFKNVYAGFLLGKADFIKEKLKDLAEKIETKEVAHKNKLKEYIQYEAIIEAVAKKYKISPRELCSMKKRPLTKKQIAIYLLRRFTPLTNREVGDIFSMKYQAVSKSAYHIGRLIKERPDVKEDVEELISNFEA